MPFNVGESVNLVVDAFLKAPIVNSVAKNPVYTALIITFIIVLIIMLIFRDADTEESLLIMSLRSGFWIFLMLLGALFVHDKLLIVDDLTDRKNTAYEDVFKGSYSDFNSSAILEDSIVPVKINTDFTI